MSIKTITQLRCNGFKNHIGIGDEHPVFSWLVESDENNVFQTAYRILVDADSSVRQGRCWDSGYVKSSQSHGIVYAGEKLKSCTTYYFKVILYFQNDKNPIESETGMFTTAILEPNLWQANWIGGDYLLRTSFMLETLPEKALGFATGLGYYELYVNGRKVDESRRLSPSLTEYSKRIEYQCYQLLPYLRKGENVVGIMLGAHWKQNPDGSNEECYQDVFYRGPVKALFQMEMEISGSRQVICSDSGWRCSPGPVVFSGIYDGEFYDARRRQDGWCSPGFDDGAWKAVTVFDRTTAELTAEILPAIRDNRAYPPKNIYRLENGDYVVDFGYNLSGVVGIKIRGKPGHRVSIRHAEVLNKDGSIDQRNLRWAKAEDVYICASEEEEFYRPHFTYHGFRYIQISGYVGELGKRDVTAFHFYSSVEQIGYFKSSDSRLNKIHDMMKRSLCNNLQSIPLDCPQRDERQGWMGDAQVSARGLIANYDMQWFYRKWLLDISDGQAEDGNIPSMTAPAWLNIEGLSYTCAYYVIVWCLYRYYDDVSAVRLHYDRLARFFAYLERHENASGLLTLTGLDDWLGVEPTPEGHIRDALYFEFAKIMSVFASVMENNKDKAYYKEKAERIRIAYNNTYYGMRGHTKKDSGYYGDCYYMGQLNNAMPICMDMTNAWEEEAIFEAFRYELTEARGDIQLTTGLIGTYYLFEALIKLRFDDIAYRLFKRNAYPSYGFMIKHGATTVWERWQYRTCNEMNSHCHPGLAAPDVWFYRVAAGIEYSLDQNHRAVFTIKPYLNGSLKEVDASQKTPWGKIAVHWKKDADKVLLYLEIPVNTTASLDLSQYSVNGQSVLKLGSGHYSFLCEA